jgi:hypothetical protein
MIHSFPLVEPLVSFVVGNPRSRPEAVSSKACLHCSCLAWRGNSELLTQTYLVCSANRERYRNRALR